MNELLYEMDERDEDAGQDAYSRARFRIGWRRAVSGEVCTEQTLRSLTWENLGYRLGRLFGVTPDAQVDELYVWCCRQHASCL
jgi:hypothetical protein